MKIIMETSLENFEFWSGAKNTAEIINEHGLWSTVESILEDLYPNGMSDTELNDIFWFENEWLFETLGINPYGEEEEEEGDENEFLEFCEKFCSCVDCPYNSELTQEDCKKRFFSEKEENKL